MTIDVLIIICYCCGIKMILQMKKNDKTKIQHLLWVNWSAFVLLIDVVYLLYKSTSFLVESELLRYLYVVFHYSLSVWMVGAMTFIHIDRVLLVLMNIKYPFYVTRVRVYYAILSLWMLCITTSVIILSIYGFQNPTMSTARVFVVFDHCIGPSSDILYIIITVAIYTTIFYHLARSRQKPNPAAACTTDVNKLKEMSKILKKSRFAFAVLLFLSYTLLIAIPDLVFTAVQYNDILNFIFTDIARVSWAVDMFLFVCMDSDVRHWLRRRLVVIRASGTKNKVGVAFGSYNGPISIVSSS